MVDRPVGLYRTQRPPHGDDIVLAVSNLTTRRIADVSFNVRSGEVVGMAGLVGAGRTETAMAIAGADSVLSGSVRLLGRDITGHSVASVRQGGVVLVPEDRKNQAIVQGLSVHENLHIGNLQGFRRVEVHVRHPAAFVLPGDRNAKRRQPTEGDLGTGHGGKA